MFGATFVPAGHFSLDHSRVDSVASGWDSLATHFPNDRIEPVEKTCFGTWFTFGQTVFQDVKATFERQAIGVHHHSLRGFKHQRSRDEMS